MLPKKTVFDKLVVKARSMKVSIIYDLNSDLTIV